MLVTSETDQLTQITATEALDHVNEVEELICRHSESQLNEQTLTQSIQSLKIKVNH